MKKILSTVLLAVCALLGMAAPEKANLECVYRLTFLTDTVNGRNVDALMVLRLGDSQSLFYPQAQFESDSLSQGAESISVLQAIKDTIQSRYGRITATYYVLKNFDKNRIDVVDDAVQTYKYTEPMPSFDWKYTEDKKTIGDYECQKATCKFGGRSYEVWFAPEIPISDGPWKFQGLPGLIVEAYDVQHHYEFSFLGMRKCAGEIAVPVEDYVKTTKYDFLKTKQLSIDDPNAFLAGIAATMGIKGNKVPKRLFYKTMELVDSIKK